MGEASKRYSGQQPKHGDEQRCNASGVTRSARGRGAVRKFKLRRGVWCVLECVQRAVRSLRGTAGFASRERLHLL